MDQSQIIALLNSLLHSQNNLSSVNNFNFQCLINPLRTIAGALNEIADFLSNLNVQNSSVNKQPSYSSVTQTNANKEYPLDKLFKSDTNKDVPNTTTQKSVSNDAFMEHLVKLKNMRNDSFYKMNRNKMLSSIMENNLVSTPIRVPKNFAPKISRTDPEEIANHKINVAIQGAKNEIEKVKLHYSIHERKVQNLDTEIAKHISTEQNEDKRNKILSNCQKIIHDASNKTIKKLKSKEQFFNSNQFMSNILYKKPNFQSTILTNTENTNTNITSDALVPYTQTSFDDENVMNTNFLSDSFVKEILTEPFEVEETVPLKRRLSNNSINSSPSQQAKKKLNSPFSSTQLSQPTFMSPTISSLSKNDKASSTSTKMKGSTQQ